jgi:hypothetical protein
MAAVAIDRGKTFASHDVGLGEGFVVQDNALAFVVTINSQRTALLSTETFMSTTASGITVAFSCHCPHLLFIVE